MYFQKLTTPSSHILKQFDFKVQKDFKALKLPAHAGEQGQMSMQAKTIITVIS